MATMFERAVGQELPGFDFPWQEEVTQNVWADLDLSTGYTFVWNLQHTSGVWRFTDVDGDREDKTTGVTGYDGGARITLAAGDLTAPTGSWTIYVTATETATGLTRVLNPGGRPKVRISGA